VTREDVMSFLGKGSGPATVAAPAAPPRREPGAAPSSREGAPPREAPAISPAALEERIPYRALRKKIGDQMVRSAFTAPHFSYVDEADMTEIVALREIAKPEAERRGIKLTFLPFVVKALVAALKRHPSLNAAMDDERAEIIVKRYYHVGIALNTDRGLLVPVVRDADKKSIYDIALDIQNLSARGRDGSITREELIGSTITITSAGSVGGLFATPILNYPEVAILGVYRIKDRPVVKDGQIVARKMGHFSLTLDHRVIDGAVAAVFMNDLIRFLEQPALLVLEG
jgi:pyruvate dehydrogenase E2 component (dihydrolipoamide acetyltransferase)